MHFILFRVVTQPRSQSSLAISDVKWRHLVKLLGRIRPGRSLKLPPPAQIARTGLGMRLVVTRWSPACLFFLEYLKTYLFFLVGSGEPVEVFLPSLYKAAECGAQQFIEKIFDLPTARIIFNRSKHKFELLEGIARNHGHEQTALYFQKITTRYNLPAFFATKRKFARLKHSNTFASYEGSSSCEFSSACYEISKPSINLSILTKCSQSPGNNVGSCCVRFHVALCTSAVAFFFTATKWPIYP